MFAVAEMREEALNKMSVFLGGFCGDDRIAFAVAVVVCVCIIYVHVQRKPGTHDADRVDVRMSPESKCKCG